MPRHWLKTFGEGTPNRMTINKGAPYGWTSLPLTGTSQSGLTYMTYPEFEPSLQCVAGECPEQYAHQASEISALHVLF